MFYPSSSPKFNESDCTPLNLCACVFAERRNVMEKERLKKEMLHKIRETKLSLLAMTEDQLHTTTKRCESELIKFS